MPRIFKDSVPSAGAAQESRFDRTKRLFSFSRRLRSPDRVRREAQVRARLFRFFPPFRTLTGMRFPYTRNTSVLN
jgi:hypothetical protein